MAVNLNSAFPLQANHPPRLAAKRMRAKQRSEESSLGEHIIVSAEPLEGGLWELHLSSRSIPARDRHVVAVAGALTPVRPGAVVDLYSIKTNLSIVHKVI